MSSFNDRINNFVIKFNFRRVVFQLKDSIIAEIVTNGIEVEKDFVENRRMWKEIQIKSKDRFSCTRIYIFSSGKRL